MNRHRRIRRAVRRLPTFEFTDLEGRTHQLPHILTLEDQLDRQVSAGHDTAPFIAALVDHPDAARAIEAMPPHIARALYDTWVDHGRRTAL